MRLPARGNRASDAIDGLAQLHRLPPYARRFRRPFRRSSRQTRLVARGKNAALRGKRKQMAIAFQVVCELLGCAAIVNRISEIEAKLATGEIEIESCLQRAYLTTQYNFTS